MKYALLVGEKLPFTLMEASQQSSYPLKPSEITLTSSDPDSLVIVLTTKPPSPATAGHVVSGYLVTGKVAKDGVIVKAVMADKAPTPRTTEFVVDVVTELPNPDKLPTSEIRCFGGDSIAVGGMLLTIGDPVPDKPEPVLAPQASAAVAPASPSKK